MTKRFDTAPHEVMHDRSARWRTAVVELALGLALLLTVACQGSDGGVDSGRGGDSARAPEGRPPAALDRPVATDGHARMVARLAELAEASQGDNPFLGRSRLVELEANLAALPADPDVRRWQLQLVLGKNRLRLGEIDRAIAHYEAAVAEWELLRDRIPPEGGAQTVFELGVAWLRKGETDNCSLRHTPKSCILPIDPEAQHVLTEGSTRAMAAFERVLAMAPLDSWIGLRARWLYNVAAMTLGKWPHAVPDAWRFPRGLIDEPREFPTFFNAAPDLGLATFDLAGGAAIEDFDLDGDLDVIVSTSDARGGMRVFHNRGDGTFDDVTAESGLAGLYGGLNLNHADFNDDGWPDLLVLRGAWWGADGKHPNSLLRNDGDGTFTDVTYEAGLVEPAAPTQCAAWADYDLDGDLDLYIGTESNRAARYSGQLWRNEGDGTFIDVASAAGVTNDRFAKAAAWGDFDGDGDPDLYVSNLPEPNRLYRNEGDGTFTDIARDAGVDRPWASFPTWFWDVNQDGHLDLYVAGYGGRDGNSAAPPDVAWFAADLAGVPNPAERPRLYLGDGAGGFRDVANEYGIADISLPMGANFGDVDGDGYHDFYLGTGYPYYEGIMPNKLYVSAGGKRFDDVTAPGGLGHLQKGHGVVFADLDDDGDQDLFEQIGGFYPGDAFANALFVNPGFGGHWLKLKLVGTQANRAAIGARVAIRIDGPDGPRTLYRTVSTGGSFGSNPLRLELGLGRADRVIDVEVRWPGFGVETFTGLDVDGGYRLVEGSGRVEPLPLSTTTLAVDNE